MKYNIVMGRMWNKAAVTQFIILSPPPPKLMDWENLRKNLRILIMTFQGMRR
jgi:hypothetical protein